MSTGTKKTVLITGGAGIVGVYAVDFMTRLPGIDRVVIGDIEEQRGMWVSNAAEVSGLINQTWLPVEFTKIDLLDIDKTSKFIEDLNPIGILHTGTLLSSYFYVPLIRKAIAANNFQTVGRQAGHTFAKDFVLVHHLMQAVNQAHVETRVSNISFPDYTNYALSKIGIAPDVGGGTIDLTVQGVRKQLVHEQQADPKDIQISMVANHGVRSVPPESIPHYIEIRANGKNLTNQLDTNDLIQRGVKATSHRFNGNITAASGVQNLACLLQPSPIVRHAPGVLDLPGGIPVELSNAGIKPHLPAKISEDAVIKMNTEAMKPDGIEQITNDGTVIFTKTCIELMEELLDLHWKQVKINQTLEMARDLIRAYKALSQKL